jgi:hypothetical protein
MKSHLNMGLVVGATVALSLLPASAQKNPLRDAYFGETHMHTSWSFDAYVFGNIKTGPEDAYKFAMGEPIEHPGGYQVKITRPLDFMAVTDHAEYAGTVRLANDPDSPISKLPIAEKLKVKELDDIQRIYLFLGTSIIYSTYSINFVKLLFSVAPQADGSTTERLGDSVIRKLLL